MSEKEPVPGSEAPEGLNVNTTYSSVKNITPNNSHADELYAVTDVHSLPNPDEIARAPKTGKTSKTMQTIAGVAGNILEWYVVYVDCQNTDSYMGHNVSLITRIFISGMTLQFLDTLAISLAKYFFRHKRGMQL